MTTVQTLRRSAALLLLSAAPLVAQPMPSAADIIAKHVAAIGGTKAIEKVQSMHQKGTMSLPAMGLTGEMEAIFAAPNKSATRLTLAGLGEIVGGTDGEVAWSINPMQGPRLLVDKELVQLKETADFQGQMLMLADRFTSIQTEGIVDFGGEKAYKVKFVSKASGNPSTRYFSVGSGLMIGTESVTTSEMGTMETRVTFADYKDFGGIKFPTKSETSLGPQSMVMTTTEVTLNAVPAGSITIPDAIKPLIKK
jgi:hypothetical protein